MAYCSLEVKLENTEWEKLVDGLVRQGLLYSPNVIKAMRNVPRAKFMPTTAQSYSNQDMPIPIGSGQTISAPHMVAIMNESLRLRVGHKVLEVGAGSGWQASTIAEVVAPSNAPLNTWGHVYTVEIIPVLAQEAKTNITNANFDNRVSIINGDGSKGYTQESPFDRIVVTAAAPKVPKPLIDQLKPDGVMVIPVGDFMLLQTLLRITKDRHGNVMRENLGEVAFVPLTGEFGFG